MKASRSAKENGKELSFAVFDTELGTCGIAWSGRGIARVQLPDRTMASLRAQLSRSGREDKTASQKFVRQAIEKLRKHLAGQPQDFSEIPLDMTAVPEFHQKVYRALRNIPAGHITTYGDLAELAGSPRAARAVGRAMSTNPIPILIPCHRVLGAAGKLGGFSSFGGVETKITLLDLEQHEKAKKAPSSPPRKVKAAVSKGARSQKLSQKWSQKWSQK
jgi:methylated-DNA-[protein]-cysteine S-methyltransferase